MKKNIGLGLFIFCLIWLSAPERSLAATAGSRLGNVVASGPSYDVDKTTQNTLTDYVGALVGVFLGLLGVIFVFLVIYGGYTWMTAAGNPEKATKAGRILKYAIIGLLVIIGVYAIWIFLFKRVVSL